MRFDIRQEFGHYRLEVNGQFHGNYDTFAEAMNELEDLMHEKQTRDVSGVAV